MEEGLKICDEIIQNILLSFLKKQIFYQQPTD